MIQTDLRGECNLKTINMFYLFVYIEPIVKYWKKNEFKGRDNKYKCPTGTTVIGDVKRWASCFVFLLCIIFY